MGSSGASDTDGYTTGTSQKIMMPDKTKYNFMGVSSIKQGSQPSDTASASGTATDKNNEYGTLMRRQVMGGSSTAGSSHKQASHAGKPDASAAAAANSSMLAAAANQNLYPSQQSSSIGQRNIGGLDSQKDSRKSGQSG